ncbi:MAG: lipid-A-disaccharide synthase N-terminal domain-containing protein [Tepidisphaeraceae bacterium]
MSLVGASMLLVYFLWRKDPVGVLGQAFGWFIYIRNLWMIYRVKTPVSAGEDPAPEPELSTAGDTRQP